MQNCGFSLPGCCVHFPENDLSLVSVYRFLVILAADIRSLFVIHEVKPALLRHITISYLSISTRASSIVSRPFVRVFRLISRFCCSSESCASVSDFSADLQESISESAESGEDFVVILFIKITYESNERLLIILKGRGIIP